MMRLGIGAVFGKIGGDSVNPPAQFFFDGVDLVVQYLNLEVDQIKFFGKLPARVNNLLMQQ